MTVFQKQLDRRSRRFDIEGCSSVPNLRAQPTAKVLDLSLGRPEAWLGMKCQPGGNHLAIRGSLTSPFKSRSHRGRGGGWAASSGAGVSLTSSQSFSLPQITSVTRKSCRDAKNQASPHSGHSGTSYVTPISGCAHVCLNANRQ